jgi:AraC-like DNA-binding protein
MTAPCSRYRSYLLPPVLRYVRERGGDTAALLQSVGLPIDVAERPSLEIDLDQLHAFFEEAALAAGDPALGLHVGLRLTEETWDLLQVVSASARSFGDALLRIAPLVPLLNPIIQLDVEPGSIWYISHRVLGHPQGLSRHGNELILAALLGTAQRETGTDIQPLSCWFGHPEASDLTVVRALVGDAHLSFGAGSTGLALTQEVADRRLKRSNPVLASVLDRLSHEAIQAQGGHAGLAGQIYRLVREGLNGTIPDVDVIARRVGMSRRSLQRRLDEERTSFRDIVDQVRRDVAVRFLSQGVPRDEIARLLGYAETTSLTRALLRWSREG